MDIANLAPLIAQRLGIDPMSLIIMLFVAGYLGKIASRAIPDDAKGVLGVIRRIGTTFAAEMPNKLTAGISTGDAARVAIGLAPPEKVEAVRDAVAAVEAVTDVLRR